jgi:hypothetical protein
MDYEDVHQTSGRDIRSGIDRTSGPIHSELERHHPESRHSALDQPMLLRCRRHAIRYGLARIEEMTELSRIGSVLRSLTPPLSAWKTAELLGRNESSEKV